jgi:glycosyltransferase involved in cell wall biosynthesis
MTHPDERHWPSIAIVTPSFNAEPFLSACLSSVLDQRYPRLQYVVMDGASSDGSVGIIRGRADALHYWTSEPDDGPYDAVAKGFAKTDAEILGWIGADDILLPWALSIVGSIFRDCPDVEWVTTETPMEIAADGLPYKSWSVPGFTKRGFRNRENSRGYPLACCIQQESTFWRRSLWVRAGARFAKHCRLAGDFELWDRFFDHALLYSVNLPLGTFRRHGEGQRSIGSGEQYNKECNAVLARHGESSPNLDAFIYRRARLAGLNLPHLQKSYEPIYVVRRSPETGRFTAQSL